MASRAKKADQEAPPIGSDDVPRCPYDIAVIEVMDRRLLDDYPFNPREMSVKARRGLSRIIKALNLLEPACVWNKRNKKLVGGHQRVRDLDEKMGTPAYKLQVCVVDLSESEHAEACIALNNAEAQGDWSVDKLAAMFRIQDTPVRVEATGFDIADIYQTFGDDAVLTGERSDDLAVLAEGLQEATERFTNLRAEFGKGRDGCDYYTVFVFKDDAARTAFHEAIGFGENRFQDGAAFVEDYAEFIAWRGRRERGELDADQGDEDAGE